MAGSLAPPRLVLAALFVVSASMLAFEVLLVRLFQYSHWHHFAGLVVSLALLGLGAAGSVLALSGRRPWARGDGLLLAGLAVQGAGTLAVLVLHSRVALRPLFASWDAGELGRLLLVDFAAFVPFAGAGLVIGQVFMRWPSAAPVTYAVNLAGSGAGSLAAGALLAVAGVDSALALAALLPVVFLPVFALAARRRLAAAVGVVLCLAGVAAVLDPPSPRVSDFKPLSRVLDMPDARRLAEQPGLPGTLTVVRTDSLRVAPGLSLQWTKPVPPVDAAVVGSNRLVPLPRRFPARADHTRASLGGLPFRLRPGGGVLVLGASGWQSVIAAEGRDLDWVEPDGRLLALARERGLAGAGVGLIEDDPYRYLANHDEAYSVIALDSAYAGGDAATEDYLMTVEGLGAALDRLTPGGLLAVPLTLSVPPRHAPRALRTLDRALRQSGAAQPGRHVAALRGLREMLLLASPRPLSARDIDMIGDFAERWRFDLAWLPALDPDRANRFHKLDGPVFFDTAAWVFGRRVAAPAAAGWFEDAPATLGQPYFWRTLRWERIPDFLRAMGRQRALSYLDWTLVLSAAGALLAAALALVLILLPVRRLAREPGTRGRLSVAGYFASLGAGYMLAEMALFQRAVLFAGEPVLAAAVVFTVFLVGSGFGSVRAPVSAGRGQVLGIFGAIAAGGSLAVLLFWGFADRLLAMPGLLRLSAVAAAILPLAWALGRAFPWALRQLAGRRGVVPWAWAVNGFASVVAAATASLASVQWSQTATLAIAGCCYAAAAVIAWRWTAFKT